MCVCVCVSLCSAGHSSELVHTVLAHGVVDLYPYFDSEFAAAGNSDENGNNEKKAGDDVSVASTVTRLGPDLLLSLTAAGGISHGRSSHSHRYS